MNIINIISFGKTDPGLRRANNEDTFLIESETGVFMIADGMGGRSAGGVASGLFASVTIDQFSKHDPSDTENTVNLITTNFNEAHSRIQSQAAATPEQEGMGCTADVVVIRDRKFTIGHVGDSRTYRLRNDVMEQLTTDHSFVQQLVDLGLITPEQAKNHHMRSVILQAVGVKGAINVEITEGDVREGDIFLLCTDGLYTMLAEKQIHHILASEMSPESKSSLLIDLANVAGGKDNITVVLAEIQEPGY